MSKELLSNNYSTSETTLNLIVTKKWYDMIESGIKKEDYRDIKQFYIKHLCMDRLRTFPIDEDGEVFDCYAKDSLNLCPICIKVDFHGIKQWWKLNKAAMEDELIYETVLFRCGYTDKTMLFKLDDISIGIGNPEWGAPQNKEVFIFKLGNRIL